MPPKHLGRVAPYSLPRTIHPRRAITSMLWGNFSVALGSRVEAGRFRLRLSDSDDCLAFRPIDELIPSYLSAITPIVVLDNDHCPFVRLVFPRNDRTPSIMILDKTWEAWSVIWQKGAERDRAKIEQLVKRNPSYRESSIRAESIYDMLKLWRRTEDIDKCLTNVGGDAAHDG